MIFEESVFAKYRGKRVLLDANLLLLFLIGSFERNRVERFKRTADFTVSDFDLLATLLQEFRSVVTTPHLLTEVSNLSNSLPEYLKTDWFYHFASQTENFLEVMHPAISIMNETSFNRYGLADAAIHSAATETLVLTEDYRLSGFLRSQGIDVLNFNDLRQMI